MTAVRRSALIVASISAFITPFMGSATNVALPELQKTFEMDAVALSWVVTSYLLVTAVFLVPFGRLADIIGRKKVFTMGMIVFTASSIWCGLAGSTPVIFAARGLQGMGSAMIFANGIAILTSVYPPRERGRVLGINVASVYIGLSAGPFLGGMMTQYLTWRSIFLAAGPLGAAVIALIMWKLKGEWAGSEGEKFDLKGSVLLGVSLVFTMYGLTRLPRPESVIMIAAGTLCLIEFFILESKIEFPVFPVSLFRTNRGFTFSSLAALINYSATTAVAFLVSLYLQYLKGMEPRDAGMVLVSQPILMALLSPLAGKLSDRVEPRYLASIGMSLTAAGLFMLARARADSNVLYIVACLAVLGVGFALFSSPNMNAIMGSVEKRLYGIASGAVATMRLVGQMLSMAMATTALAILVGRVEITPERYPDFMKSMTVSFSIFAGLCALGVLASLARGDIMNNGREGPARED